MSGTSDYSEELYAYLDVFFGELAMRLRYTLAGSPYELLVIEIDVFQEYCPSSLSIAALLVTVIQNARKSERMTGVISVGDVHLDETGCHQVLHQFVGLIKGYAQAGTKILIGDSER